MIDMICCHLDVIRGKFHVDFMDWTLRSDQYLQSDDRNIHIQYTYSTYGLEWNFKALLRKEVGLKIAIALPFEVKTFFESRSHWQTFLINSPFKIAPSKMYCIWFPCVKVLYQHRYANKTVNWPLKWLIDTSSQESSSGRSSWARFTSLVRESIAYPHTDFQNSAVIDIYICLLYTSPSPRD